MVSNLFKQIVEWHYCPDAVWLKGESTELKIIENLSKIPKDSGKSRKYWQSFYTKLLSNCFVLFRIPKIILQYVY